MNEHISGQGLFYTYVEANKKGRRTFQLLGREWDLLPDVDAPTYSYATTFYSTNVPYPLGGAMLEKLYELIPRSGWHARLSASGNGEPDDHLDHFLFQLSPAPIP